MCQCSAGPNPAQQLHSSSLILSTAAAEVHPVGVVVVVQSLVLMHKGLVLVQLCQGKGSSQSWHGGQAVPPELPTLSSQYL